MRVNELRGFDFGLGETADILRNNVRSFAADRIAPRADEIDRNERVPPRSMARDGQARPARDHARRGMGRCRPRLSRTLRRHGGDSRASAAVGLSYGAHSNLAVNQIRRNGTDAQKRKFLPKLVSGEHVGALAMSEPGAGSDVVAMKTRAEKRGDRYVLNGNKMWITNGPQRGTARCLRQNAPPRARAASPRSSIEKDMQGFSTAQKLDKLGMRGSDTCELVFEDCEVPEDNVLGESARASHPDVRPRLRARGAGGRTARHHAGRMDIVMPYVHERKQFGKSIGEFQLMQGKLADMYVKHERSQAYVYAVARPAIAAGPRAKMPPALFCTQPRMRPGSRSKRSRLSAATAISTIMRRAGYLRDAKLYEIGAGTSEIRRMLIGRELFEKTDRA